MRFKALVSLGLSLMFILTGCTHSSAGHKIKIGLSLDTLKEERWQHDRDLFVARAQQLGAEVLVQVADNNAALQNSQCENLLTEGVNVLVVVPHNGKSAATIVKSAHKAGVPVIAYDRLINNCDLDLYVTFDPYDVGVQQAEYAVKHQPKGNYVLIAGAPTDNNAILVHQGQMSVLKPYVEKGQIKIVADQWANDWSPVEALKITEDALTQNNNQVSAIVVSNDGMAGGVVQALTEQNLEGKVLVTGQDADLAACQRIAQGTQSMTIYKPLYLEADKAAEMAIDLAEKKSLPVITTKLNNGKIDVPSILLKTIVVDQNNLNSTVIADGFQKKEAVYKQ